MKYLIKMIRKRNRALTSRDCYNSYEDDIYGFENAKDVISRAIYPIIFHRNRSTPSGMRRR